MKMRKNHEKEIILCRRTPVKGILKSRPVTPDVSASVGEKSKVFFLLLLFLKKNLFHLQELAEMALNMINPGRK